MVDKEEFRIILSVAQMAAILEKESLSAAEISSNRIFGSIRLVGGIVELAGASALCVTPDPTLLTKVGCVAMGVHGADQSSAGLTQIITGSPTDSFAFKTGSSIARSMGASDGVRQFAGLSTEFAIPLATASLFNAFRVSSVQGGKMVLRTGEKLKNAPKKSHGGHTMRDHLDKDIAGLAKRLKKFRNVEVMSTFDNIEIAEWAVRQALNSNRTRIAMYSRAKFLRVNNRLTLKMDLKKDVGWGIARRAPDTPVGMKKIVVVIEFTEYNYMPAYILTSYPIL
ncbi:RNase A-like domain-containing protein [Pseudomonas huanghezhanensis]|uniref:RNase A-like domain-containing protein n=1 Tax=Pseudomonas huanghezhanensis TaxID=3002903 RepID=UPI0022864ED1|nr:RNase A-like domain-containing protein [Pseudomonas sp. BSw22131]